MRPRKFDARLGFGVIVGLGALLAASAVVDAQLTRPKADVVPLVERQRVHAGTSARVALKVSLPEGLHVQSNKPRDPSLIPTEVRIEPPDGFSLAEIVFPTATDFKQVGQDQPLAVFERAFVIGMSLTLADTVPAGNVVVPVHLRYQACDANVCFPPSTADAEWSMDVVPASAALGAAGHADVFKSIAFGSGEAPVSVTLAKPVQPAPAAGASGLAILDDFTVLASDGGYMGSDKFLQFIRCSA